MVIAEGDDDFALVDDDRNQGAFFQVQVLQRDPDIGITFTGDKLNGLRFAADQPVQPFDLGAVGIDAGTDVTENG